MGKIYNGYPQTSYTDWGAGKDDVMPIRDGIFTRGVLFDIPKLKAVPYLGDHEPSMRTIWRPERRRPASAWKAAM
jgi:hypothetical protein